MTNEHDTREAMQAEIDELRAEISLITTDLRITTTGARESVQKLRTENARLRDALEMMVHAQSSILGLGDSPAVKVARAALGKS